MKTGNMIKRTDIRIAAVLILISLTLLSAGCNVDPEVRVHEKATLVNIYFIAMKGKVCYLKPLRKRINNLSSNLETLIEELIAGPPENCGLLPVTAPGTKVLGISLKKGVLTLYLSREFLRKSHRINSEGVPATLRLQAIANTMTEVEGIEAIRILVEGKSGSLIDGYRIEDYLAGRPLPELLRRNKEVIGRRALPRWRFIDKTNLANRLGWGEITQGTKEGAKVALTFDAGAGASPVGTILNTLKKHGLKCTFFITGKFAERFPHDVKGIAAEGHEIGNHSYSHPNFTSAGAEELEREADKTEEVVTHLCGLSTKPYFRFPYGARTDALVKRLNEIGYLSIYWSADSLDWSTTETPETIAGRVLSRIFPGSIVLMHSGSEAGSKALDTIIINLQKRGYEIVTVTELLI